MTDKRLEEIRKRVEAATPGPWEVEDYRCDGDWRSTGNVWARNKGHYHPGTKVCEVNCHSMSSISDPRDIGEFEGNSAFIAHARDDIPFLLAEVERLRALEAEHKRQWMEDKYEMGNLRAERDTLRRQLDEEKALTRALERNLLKAEAQLEVAVGALNSIAAIGVQDFDERLQRVSRGDLISAIDTDTAVAREAIAQIEAIGKEGCGE